MGVAEEIGTLLSDFVPNNQSSLYGSDKIGCTHSVKVAKLNFRLTSVAGACNDDCLR